MEKQRRKRGVQKICHYTPEAKSILQNWFNANEANPYPTSDEKNGLSVQTGLTIAQISSYMEKTRAKRGLKRKSLGKSTATGDATQSSASNKQARVVVSNNNNDVDWFPDYTPPECENNVGNTASENAVAESSAALVWNGQQWVLQRGGQIHNTTERLTQQKQPPASSSQSRTADGQIHNNSNLNKEDEAVSTATTAARADAAGGEKAADGSSTTEQQPQQKQLKAKRKKRKKNKDPNHPKHNRSAFTLYSNAHRERVKGENPDAKFGDIAKLLNAEFKELSEDDKAEWNEKADADKQRYLREMEDYVPPSDDSNSADRKKCSFVDPKTAEKCSNFAWKNTEDCCRRHNPNLKKCSFVDPKTGEKCSLAAHSAKFCKKHNPDKCSFCIDPNTKEMCQNVVQKNGLCGRHGGQDKRICKNETEDGKRCILTRMDGSEYCGRCSDAPTTACQEDECTCNATFGGYCDDHYPPHRLYHRMKQIIKDLKSHMSEKQHKAVLGILEINRILIEDRFQDKKFSLDLMISELAVEIAGVHLAHEKYQDKRVWNGQNTETRSLPLHVHQKIMSVLNVATCDLRTLFEYAGLPIKLQDQIVDTTLSYIMENCLGENDQGEKCLLGVKAGTGTDRKYDARLYPKSLVDHDKEFKFDITVPPNERHHLERFLMSFLAGLGIGFNLHLTTNMIPHTDKCSPDLYLMTAKSELVPFLRDHGLHLYGERLRKGWVAVRAEEINNLRIALSELRAASDLVDNVEIVNTETTPAAPTAAGGVVDESSGAAAPDAEDDDSVIDCSNNFTGDGEDEDDCEDDEKLPTFFDGTPSSTTSPHELLSTSLSSDNTRVVTPTNVPETNHSNMMDRKLAAETRFYEANAAKAELETRDLQRNYAVTDLCERSKRRFVESHLSTNPKRVRAVLENEQLVKSVVSSSYKGTEVAPPLMSQDINEKLEQIIPNED
jgi:hypothetical protein